MPTDDTDYRAININTIIDALDTLEKRMPDDVMDAMKQIMDFCIFSLCLMDVVTMEQAQTAAELALSHVFRAREQKSH